VEGTLRKKKKTGKKSLGKRDPHILGGEKLGGKTRIAGNRR